MLDGYVNSILNSKPLYYRYVFVSKQNKVVTVVNNNYEQKLKIKYCIFEDHWTLIYKHKCSLIALVFQLIIINIKSDND